MLIIHLQKLVDDYDGAFKMGALFGMRRKSHINGLQSLS